MNETDRLRMIPSVSEVLEKCLNRTWSQEYSRDQIVEAIREKLADLRNRFISEEAIPEFEIVEKVHDHLTKAHLFSLKKVINATGIIVHTNLGRSPISEEALRRIVEVAGGYSNLEFDLEAGQRGSRDEHLEKFLSQLLPIEACLVVNNNAAALILILNTLAEGKEVIVSRGELVEIGGSFRLPEIMKKSGAILREIGATNKTRIEDYRKAVTPGTAMILVVHPSNFQIIGFTEKPLLREVVAVGKEWNIPVVEDQGSGILLNLESLGITDEPEIGQRLEEGVDLICFSGDKILGGPQAGVICGKQALVNRLRSNPLFRALRVDKMVYAALEATVLQYLKNQAANVPVVAMLSRPVEELRSRGASWLSELQQKLPAASWKLESTTSYVGGGVAPMKGLSSCAVSLSHPDHSAQEISLSLRRSVPPIVARIEGNRLFFDLRTISVAEQSVITSALQSILPLEPARNS